MLAHITDMSQLIVERNTLFLCITPTLQDDENRIQTLNCLFVMFNNFFIKLRENKSTFSWSEHPDLVMVNIISYFALVFLPSIILFSIFL